MKKKVLFLIVGVIILAAFSFLGWYFFNRIETISVDRVAKSMVRKDYWPGRLSYELTTKGQVNGDEYRSSWLQNGQAFQLLFIRDTQSQLIKYVRIWTSLNPVTDLTKDQANNLLFAYFNDNFFDYFKSLTCRPRYIEYFQSEVTECIGNYQKQVARIGFGVIEAPRETIITGCLIPESFQADYPVDFCP